MTTVLSRSPYRPPSPFTCTKRVNRDRCNVARTPDPSTYFGGNEHPKLQRRRTRRMTENIRSSTAAWVAQDDRGLEYVYFGFWAPATSATSMLVLGPPSLEETDVVFGKVIQDYTRISTRLIIVHFCRPSWSIKPLLLSQTSLAFLTPKSRR